MEYFIAWKGIFLFSMPCQKFLICPTLVDLSPGSGLSDPLYIGSFVCNNGQTCSNLNRKKKNTRGGGLPVMLSNSEVAGEFFSYQRSLYATRSTFFLHVVDKGGLGCSLGD